VAGPISIPTSPRCHKGGGLLLFKRPVHSLLGDLVSDRGSRAATKV
jgi:hypothetical protein